MYQRLRYMLLIGLVIFCLQSAWACVTPYTSMTIDPGTTVLCPGTYQVSHLLLKSNNTQFATLDCNGSTLVGDGSSYAVTFSDYGGSVRNCHIENFSDGIYINGDPYSYKKDISLTSNTFKGNNIGINLKGFIRDVWINANTFYDNGYNTSYGYVQSGIESGPFLESVQVLKNTFYDGFHTTASTGIIFCDNGQQNTYIGSLGPNCSGWYPFTGMRLQEPISLIPGTYNYDTTRSMWFNANSNSGLDCRGSTLIGNHDMTGVYLYDTHNITIKNCHFTNMSKGIETDTYYSMGVTTGNDVYQGNLFTDNDYGIYLGGQNYAEYNHLITNNTFTNNTHLEFGMTFPSGIYTTGSRNSTIYANHIYDGLYTKAIDDTDYCHNNTPNYYYGAAVGPTCEGYYPFPDTILYNSARILPGNYTCTPNVTHWFRSGNSDIELDCAGAGLSCDSQNTALYIYGDSNVTVKNCILSGFEYGINIDSYVANHIYSSHAHVVNNTLQNNAYGVYLKPERDSKNHDIINNTFINNTHLQSGRIVSSGIYYKGQNDGTITNNKVYDAIRALTIDNTTYCVDGQHNTYYGNATGPDCDSFYPYSGIEVYNSGKLQPGTYNMTSGIRIKSSGITLDCNGAHLFGPGSLTGIDIGAFDSTTIHNCTIHGFKTGTALDIGAQHNTIQYSDISGNNNYGLYLYGADNNTITNNLLSDNGLYDLYLRGADYNLITYNTYGTIYNNTATNIFVMNKHPSPDLAVTNAEVRVFNNTYRLDMLIENIGTSAATDASLTVFESDEHSKQTVTIYNRSLNLGSGQSYRVNLTQTTSHTDKHLLIYIDTGNSTEDSNQSNNLRRLTLYNTTHILHKPFITRIIPQYTGTMIYSENLVIANHISIEVQDPENDIISVSFSVNNVTYTDTNSSDGWGIDLPITFSRDATVIITATDASGQTSDPRTLRIQTVAYASLPPWLSSRAYPLNASLEFLTEEQAYNLLVGLAEPINKSFNVPDSVPVIGGDNYIKSDFSVGVLYIINDNEFVFSGEGYAEGKVFKRKASARAIAEGTVTAESLNAIYFHEGRAYLALEVEAFTYPYTYTIPVIGTDVEIEASISPKIDLEGDFGPQMSVNKISSGIAADLAATAELDMSDDLLVPARALVELNGELKVIGIYVPATNRINAYGTARGDARALVEFMGFYREAYATGWYTYPEQPDMNNSYYTYGTRKLDKPYFHDLVQSTLPMAKSPSIGPIQNAQLTDNDFREEDPSSTILNNATYTVFTGIYANYSILASEIYLHAPNSTIRLTDNALWDFAPAITTAQDHLLITWVENTALTNDSDYQQTLRSLSSHEIMYALYYPDGTLTTPTALTDDTSMDGTPYVYNDTIVWVKDTDSNILTKYDREIYKAHFAGTWNISQLTSDNLTDSQPVVCGNIFAWVKNTSVVTNGSFLHHSASNIRDLVIACDKDTTFLAWIDNNTVNIAQRKNNTWVNETIHSADHHLSDTTVQLIGSYVFVAWRELSHPEGDIRFIVRNISRPDWGFIRNLTNDDLTQRSLNTIHINNTAILTYIEKAITTDDEVILSSYTLMPDLALSNITITPQSDGHGNVTVTIENLGEHDSGQATFELFVNDAPIHTESIIVPYAKTLVMNYSILLPNEPFNLSGHIIYTGTEHNRTNNNLTLKRPLRPVYQVMSHTSRVEGGMLNMTLDIANTGYVSGPAELHVLHNQTLLYNMSFNIPSSMHQNISFLTTIPSETARYSVLINSSYSLYNTTINILPDCVITSINISYIGHITSQVANLGLVRATCPILLTRNNLSEQLYRSSTTLEPGQQENISISYLPDSIGIEYIYAITDYSDIIEEINESNNYQYRAKYFHPDPNIVITNTYLEKFGSDIILHAKASTNGIFTSDYKLICYKDDTLISSSTTDPMPAYSSRWFNCTYAASSDHNLSISLLNQTRPDANLSDNIASIHYYAGVQPPIIEITENYQTPEDTPLIIQPDITSTEPLTITSNSSRTEIVGHTITYFPYPNTSYQDSVTLSFDTNSYSFTRTININVTPVDDSPYIVSTPNTTARVGEYYTYLLQAFDNDTAELTYAVNNSLFIQHSNMFYLLPDSEQGGTSMPLEFLVADGNSTVTQKVVLTIYDVNHAPVLAAPSTIYASENQTVTLNITTFDADNDTLTVSYSAPFSQGYWTPGFDDNGTYNITITADDGKNTTTTNVLVTIFNHNRRPFITPLSNITMLSTSSLTLSPSVSDPDNDSIFLTYTSPFESDGTIIHPQPGTYFVNVTASDGQYNSTSRFTLLVHEGKLIDLSQKWNLIPIGPLNVSVFADNVCDKNVSIKYVALFNASSQEYITHPCHTPVNRFKIEPDQSYFIFSDFNISIDIALSDTTEQFQVGWNAAVINGTAASSYCNNNDSVIYISRYDPLSQKFQTHPCNAPINDFPLLMTKGYFIYIGETT